MYETLTLGVLGGDSKELEVPEGTNAFISHVMGRFYEPNAVQVPEEQVNMRSMRGKFRKPEFCYGDPAYNPEEGTSIGGSYAPLDHVMELHAQYDISRHVGKDLIKLMIAKRFALGEHEHQASDETQTMLDSINDALGDYARLE